MKVQKTESNHIQTGWIAATLLNPQSEAHLHCESIQGQRTQPLAGSKQLGPSTITLTQVFAAVLDADVDQALVNLDLED